jgi:cytochrome c peroxidase
MNRKKLITITVLAVAVLFFQFCSKSDTGTTAAVTPTVDPFANIKAALNIDPNNLLNYANQGKPNYILKDNAGGAVLSNAKTTLGRVLFYDKNLSIDNSISCGSCHKQQFAFGDTEIASKGVAGGLTGRHSMRLINARFAVEQKFFWDERAATLEAQTTRPIQDHAEMGFSGQSGRPGLADLLVKLQAIKYYNEFFKFVYGDITITEARLQECLASFVRSIQSFDSKFDAGRALVANDGQPFPNFTAQENQGKQLFIGPPVFDATGNRIGGGAGCNGCHNAPEFDIAPVSGNNGVIGKIPPQTGIDITVTRAPSLRDVVNGAGIENGPLMHVGDIQTLQGAVTHYNIINLAPGNTNLDPKLRPNGFGQHLNLTTQEMGALVAFLRTLSGTNVYVDTKWSNPFK